MKLDDDDIAFFGALMYLAGKKHRDGVPTGELGTAIDPGEVKHARELAAAELVPFRRRVKQKRRSAPKGGLPS